MCQEFPVRLVERNTFWMSSGFIVLIGYTVIAFPQPWSWPNACMLLPSPSETQLSLCEILSFVLDFAFVWKFVSQKSGQPEGQTCDLELLSALSSGSVVDSSALNPVRQFTDADGKAVAVYDQVLSAEDLLKLRQHWLSSCSTFQYQFDDGMLGGMNHKETQKSLPWLVEISVSL